jgi:hypothetical protein
MNLEVDTELIGQLEKPSYFLRSGNMEDITESPEYKEWLEKLAKECKCCPICSDKPCDGLMAGGFCDELCFCDEHDEDLDEFGHESDEQK